MHFVHTFSACLTTAPISISQSSRTFCGNRLSPRNLCSNARPPPSILSGTHVTITTRSETSPFYCQGLTGRSCKRPDYDRRKIARGNLITIIRMRKTFERLGMCMSRINVAPTTNLFAVESLFACFCQVIPSASPIMGF